MPAQDVRWMKSDMAEGINPHGVMQQCDTLP